MVPLGKLLATVQLWTVFNILTCVSGTPFFSEELGSILVPRRVRLTVDGTTTLHSSRPFVKAVYGKLKITVENDLITPLIPSCSEAICDVTDAECQAKCARLFQLGKLITMSNDVLTRAMVDTIHCSNRLASFAGIDGAEHPPASMVAFSAAAYTLGKNILISDPTGAAFGVSVEEKEAFSKQDMFNYNEVLVNGLAAMTGILDSIPPAADYEYRELMYIMAVKVLLSSYTTASGIMNRFTTTCESCNHGLRVGNVGACLKLGKDDMDRTGYALQTVVFDPAGQELKILASAVDVSPIELFDVYTPVMMDNTDGICWYDVEMVSDGTTVYYAPDCHMGGKFCGALSRFEKFETCKNSATDCRYVCGSCTKSVCYEPPMGYTVNGMSGKFIIDGKEPTKIINPGIDKCAEALTTLLHTLNVVEETNANMTEFKKKNEIAVESYDWVITNTSAIMAMYESLVSFVGSAQLMCDSILLYAGIGISAFSLVLAVVATSLLGYIIFKLTARLSGYSYNQLPSDTAPLLDSGDNRHRQSASSYLTAESGYVSAASGFKSSSGYKSISSGYNSTGSGYNTVKPVRRTFGADPMIGDGNAPRIEYL